MIDTSFSDARTINGHDALQQVLAQIEAIIPPLWPLEDYVAVNPFVGMAEQNFLEALQALGRVRDCSLLMPCEYFQSRRNEGKLTDQDLAIAYSKCVEEYPELYAEVDLAEVLSAVEKDEPSGRSLERQFRTVAECVDCYSGSTWSSHIVNDISRHCGAYFDRGQAIWTNPWKQRSLYEAWYSASRIGRRMDLLGLKGFHRFVDGLPETSIDAIPQLLDALDVPQQFWKEFLLCELFSIAGWASYVRYHVREAEMAGTRDESLIDLLAIRLAYDVALAEVADRKQGHSFWPGETEFGADRSFFPKDVLWRYLMQVATEIDSQRTLCRALSANTQPRMSTSRKTLQIVFCIDVRSEIMRRHLESVSDAIETFGFAGFFGLALEYVPLGGSTGSAQYPVLLTSGFRVHESLLGADKKTVSNACRQRKTLRTGRKLWKSFQTCTTSCFAFVESVGLAYFGKLITDSLRLTRPVATCHRDGLPSDADWQMGPDLCFDASSGLSESRRIDLAESLLKNLGLTEGFARVVALCAHEAEVVNNPYKAGLDCGACGGHSGEPNARVAAALLNDHLVRKGLADRGLQIPGDTWFVAGVHNTTTDEIRFCEPSTMPETHAEDFDQIQKWIQDACRMSRIERSGRLGVGGTVDQQRRSRDWSEVRPEWGLAGNAAFIVAPRWRTKGLKLDGRTFMHSYDFRKDSHFKVLELIMTAPMIVTSWINLQYYASTVDNRAFGSGNKVIHNVVGQFGVFEGNGGDLMTGLPFQSIHDGQRLQHEPLRLLVMIEAPRLAVERIINKHETVNSLVTNGWLSLVVLDGEKFHRWTAQREWKVDDPANGNMPE